MTDEHKGPCGEYCAVVDECAARGAEIERLMRERDEALRRRIVYSPDAKALSDRADAAERKVEKLREALKDATASVVAATSLLQRGGKKAAPSNKMFDQMVRDYMAASERARAALKETKG